MINFSFSKNLRLLTSFQFSNVFKKSFKIRTKEVSILGCSNKLIHPRLGIIIARKKIRRSHDRSNFKRLVRETFRLSQHKLICLDYVVIVNNNTILLHNNRFLIKLLEGLWIRYYRIFLKY